MKAFLYSVALHGKMDFRTKEVLLTYYAVPLVFFLFMGGVFSSIMPGADQTLIQTMTVFGVSMGTYLGAPAPLAQLYGSEVKNAYRVGGIPLWTPAACNFIAGFVHLFIMSLVIFLLAPLIFGAAVPQDIPLYFAALAAFIAVCLSVGTVLGVFLKGSTKLTMVSQLVFLPSVLLSGIMVPMSMLPEALQTIGLALPATWGYLALCDASLQPGHLWPLGLILVAMLALALFRIRRLSKAEG